MLRIVDDPWKALLRIAKEYGAGRADILTGYVGDGARAALTTLGLRARIVIGLASESAALSETQVAELKRLAAKHQVRWLPGLHAKLYLLDDRVVVAGSANLTRWGFEKLDEILIATDDELLVRTLRLSKGGVRLLAAWPKSIPDLEKYSSLRWTTSTKSPVGQVHVLAITKTGDGIEKYATDPRVDAVHSIWRTTSLAKKVKSVRWPIQATFKNVVVLDKPVPKGDLVAADIIKERWPQHPSSGKLLKGRDLQRLADLLATANPHQGGDIRAALVPAGGGRPR